ncbi:hypothetical protein G7054_g3743 [Neopestalotiopsis clavispora]|nr:hypothetical protein G7054_g3743 [Neopestalotiopsis clavispora]
MHPLQISLTVVALVSACVKACTTDEDCSLNGVCDSGSCSCDAGWKSEDCGELDLYPAKRGSGYNYTDYVGADFYNVTGAGNSSWCGEITQDRNNKTHFHMIASQFSHGCGLNRWKPFSTVIRASSTRGPAGPYIWAQDVLPAWHHNPTWFWSEADQKYLLYSIGDDVNLPTTCQAETLLNNVSVTTSTDLVHWDTPKRLFTGKTNPAAMPLYSAINHTSEILLALEDNFIYRADNYTAPYELVYTPTWNVSNYSPRWTEDPFLWRDKRGFFHILAHYMIDITERGEKGPHVGVHLFARNYTGPWTFREKAAYNTTVQFTDGTSINYYRRERPKVFFDEDGTPLYLVNGVAEEDSRASYTIVVPIGAAAAEYEKTLGF